jgi:hypothetical protein
MEQEEQETDFQTLGDLSPPECLVNFTLSGTSPTTSPMGLLSVWEGTTTAADIE